MWVFTDRGFYSVVEDRVEGQLVVRARRKADLVALREFIPGLQIVRLENRDYEFRAFVWRSAWEDAIIGMTRAIDYTNFKDTVKKRQGPVRAGIYSRIWAVALDIASSRKSRRFSDFARGGRIRHRSLFD